MLDTEALDSLRAIDDCASACLQCATSCLAEADPSNMRRCITLDLQCADVCRLAAAALARDDDNLRAVLQLCADACHICADECGRHALDHCQRCATACLQCAESCRALVH